MKRENESSVPFTTRPLSLLFLPPRLEGHLDPGTLY
jgi:hypothetical protein